MLTDEDMELLKAESCPPANNQMSSYLLAQNRYSNICSMNEYSKWKGFPLWYLITLRHLRSKYSIIITSSGFKNLDNRLLI